MRQITLQEISITELTEIISKAVKKEINNLQKAPEQGTNDTLTRKELREFLGVCDCTLWKYLKKGLPVYQVGRRQLFKKSEVLNFMKRKN